jgi:DNA-binding transcriptional ArsR family regulator
VERLAAGEKSAGELGKGLAISQPAVSKHLRVLREAGLVAARVESQRRMYRLTPAPLARVDAWLQRYRALWDSRLDAMSEVLGDSPYQRLRPIVTRYPGRSRARASMRRHHFRAIQAA